MDAKVSADDYLVLTIWSIAASPTVSIYITTLSVKGRIETQRYDRVAGSTGSRQQFRFALYSGTLLSVSVSVYDVIVSQSDLLIECRLEFGTVLRQAIRIVLIRDYLTSRLPLSWPGNHLEDVRKFPDFITTIVIANPAVGSNFSFTVPTNTAYEVQSLIFLLTNSGVAGNRQARLFVDDGANRIFVASSVTSVTALTIARVCFAPGFTTGGNQGTGVNVSMPKLLVNAGMVIGSAIVSLDVGDAITDIFLVVKRRLTDVSSFDSLPA